MPVLDWILLAVVVVVIAGLVILWARNYRKVGPNQVLVVSGRSSKVTEPDGAVRKVGYRLQVGGGTFVVPLMETYDVLPLEVYSISLRCPEVLTGHGVSISAEAQGQVKLRSDEVSLHNAVENFLSKGSSGITYVAQEVLEGHMRAILGTMSVEEIYSQREAFAEGVRQKAEADFERLGLELVSFALKDISDTQDYINSLGARRIAEVKRDAIIAKAETERDAIIRASQYRKEGDIEKLKSEAELADATKDFELQRADFQTAVNAKRAQADAAYDIERTKYAEELKRQEYKVRITEKELAAEVENLEIGRREKELEASVKRPAEAMNYQAKLEADSEAYQEELRAKGKAAGVRAVGKAEAEAMKEKAAAWREYTDTALKEMAVKNLPELARAVSEPLSNVDKIIMVGDANGPSKLTGQVASVLAQLPEVVESLSGIDIKELLPGSNGKGSKVDKKAKKE